MIDRGPGIRANLPMARRGQPLYTLTSHPMTHRWPDRAIGRSWVQPYLAPRNGHADASRRGHRNRTRRNKPMTQPDDLDAPETLLTPSEVAALFRVNPK